MRHSCCLAILLFGSITMTYAQPGESRLMDKLTASTVLVHSTRADGTTCMGTGWVLHAGNRLLVTAAHVVDRAERLQILFPRRTTHGWVRNPEALQAKATPVAAEVARMVRSLDLAILRVAEIPDGASALPLAEKLPRPGDKLFTVGHPVKTGQVFRFDQGTVEFTGFAAVDVPVDGQPAVQVRGEVICFRSPSVDKGSSGGAVVNAQGNVVGWVVMGSGLIDRREVNNVVVSFRELQRVLEQGQSRDLGKPYTLSGRWIGVMPNARAEIGIEFTKDGLCSFIIPGGGKIAGRYQLQGNNLLIKTPGKTETIPVEWTASRQLRLRSEGFTADCRKYDAAW